MIDLIISFMFGFSVATIMICRATMRPKAKTVLKAIGLTNELKAVIPKPKKVVHNYADREI